MSFTKLAKLGKRPPPYRRNHHIRKAREARKARQASKATDTPPILPTQPPIYQRNHHLTGAREARKAREAREAYGSNECALRAVSLLVIMLLHAVGYALRSHRKSIIVFKIYIYIMIQSPTSQISSRSTEQLQRRIRAGEQRVLQVGRVGERGE